MSKDTPAHHAPAHHTLVTYLRHELCTPISGMIGYSDLLLEELQSQPSSTLFEDLQKIRSCSQQLLELVTAILDPEQLEKSQIDGDLDSFGATLRMELLTPLSTIIGYCEMLLEEAPAELIPDIDKLNGSAQQLLALTSDIVHLAQQQLQMITTKSDSTAPLSLESLEAAHLAKSVTSALQVLQQDSLKQPPQGGMILVIDDNPTNCDLLARQLKKQAYTVTTATSAQQGLRLLRALSYDLILLDVIMPGMSGVELLQQLKSHDTWRHIPVIMISALDEIEGAVRCIELGAEDYLHKPFDPTLLKARIGAYLERKQLRDQEILYLQQVKRLTTAAAAVEANSFEPESLNDLIQYPDELGQLARVFQHMAQEVHSREQHLAQQLHLLQVSIDSGQKQQMIAEVVETDHFQQLQERTKGSLDIENLYRSSLYPSLSQQFSQQVSFSDESSEYHADNSKIIAVHSFRGGTGKSNITSSLAISMAKQGKRVGVVDTDLLSPGVHVLFGLKDRALGHTLNSYLWGESTLYEAAQDLSYLLKQESSPPNSVNANGAIYLVPASTKPSDITRITREGYQKEKLTDGFHDLIGDLQLDYLFIDTHPGISEETLQTISMCNLLVVVLRPDYQDYQGTSVLVELAKMLSVEEMQLVVNKALPAFDVPAYRQQLETAYEVPVSKVLPFSEALMHLASSEVFSLRYPEHPLAQAIDAMSQRIAEPSASDEAIASTKSKLSESKLSTGKHHV